MSGFFDVQQLLGGVTEEKTASCCGQQTGRVAPIPQWEINPEQQHRSLVYLEYSIADKGV